MSTDLCHLNIFLILAEFVFMFWAFAVILIDGYHSLFERSLLWSYLPQWRQRNLRHNVYLCLLGYGITIMYANSVQDLPNNTLNRRLAVTSCVVLLAFLWQNKIRPETASDQSATHPQDRLSKIRSLLLPVTSDDEPQSDINFAEELLSRYVKDYRETNVGRKVPEEKLKAAIKYLNRLKGGIKAQRSSFKLISAIDHLDIMRSHNRMDDSGFPLEYSPEELLLILDSRKYRFKDVLRVLKNHLETNSFLPSPKEFVELYHKMKGIVQLEEALEETRKEKQIVVEEKTQALESLEETRQENQIVVEEKTQALESLEETRKENQIVVEEKTQALESLEETRQEMEERTQKLVECRKEKLELRVKVKQHLEVLQQKDRKISQMIQRVRELEENPEYQRRICDLEEENRRLAAQSQRSLCKVCQVKEVQVFFLPCTHLITCEGCVSTLPQRKCPMCWEEIQDTKRVLLA